MSDFQGDVLLYDTEDGGEISFSDDNLVMDDTGFETAIYLSLFGGNELDDGSESTKKYQYWGNLLENDPKYKLTSQAQNIIEGYPATPNNLNRIKEAVKQDLNWMINEGIIDKLEITATIPERNRLNLTIKGYKDKNKIINTTYELNWLSKLS